ncbi:MAG: ATP-binding cassette domain-containing protein [Anaerolineae bacterium]|nr:ATP-binding cassette domain-containing protein [Anaerolineae bacterium]
MQFERAVSVEHVQKNYGKFRAVDDLTFEVHGGEIFAMLGPNGSGKTTTIRMILDILKPDTGQIRVLGGPLTEATKMRIGYLPEERGLYRNVPVLDVMIYLGRLKGLSGDEARQRSLALLQQLELDEFSRKKVSELSKGMQQKVQFAVTVLHQPDLIIIDEPFSGLDPVNTLVIKRLLTDLRSRGCAIIMSTHQMQQVEEMADRLLMISNGQQKLYGSVQDIREQFALHAIIVEGQGDWGKLPGVVSVEPAANGNGHGADRALLRLDDQTAPGDVLAAIAASGDMHVRRFEEAVPGLNDIFIQVAEGAH